MARRPIETPSLPLDAEFGAEGAAAAACSDGRILLIDPSSDANPKELEHGDSDNLSAGDSAWPRRLIRFSPDGKSFVTFSMGKTARVWESPSGQPRCPPLEHGATCSDASFSPDGRSIATGSWDKTARVWDSRTGQPMGVALHHSDRVLGISFSPDGNLLVTACFEAPAHVWDWRTGRLVGPPLELGGALNDAKFTIDGGWVITHGAKDIARFWEWQTGRPVSPPLALFEPGIESLITPDGERAIVGGFSSWINVVSLSDLLTEANGKPTLDALRLWGEILSCQRLHEDGGGTVRLSTAEWFARWERFRREHRRHPFFQSPFGSGAQWHRLRAEALERGNNWEAARWHLLRLQALGDEVEPGRLARFDEFVRAWFILRSTVAWRQTDPLPVVDAARLKGIEEVAIAERLFRSPAPFIDLERFFPDTPANRIAYSVREIQAQDKLPVKILTGSDDKIRIWLNGEKVHENPALRVAEPDDDSAPAMIRPGRNVLVVEIAQAEGGWGFYLRLEDDRGRKLRLTDAGKLESIDANY